MPDPNGFYARQREKGGEIVPHNGRSVDSKQNNRPSPAVLFPFFLMLFFVLFLWIVEIIDQVVFHGALDNFGIIPRDVTRLWAIVLAPLLHDGYAHLAANTLPLLVLGTVTGITSRRSYFAVSGALYLFSGMFIWVFAPGNTLLVGASGLCYSYLGYILARGFFGGRLISLAIAAFVWTIYSPTLIGVLPNSYAANVSWQGHLIGFLVGAVVAFLQGRKS